MQRKATHALAHADLDAPLPGGGAPLPGDTRRQLEDGLGVDLGGVRVHTDGAAADRADGLAARAFASGQDIYFGRGEYDPGSRDGQHLLAHEVVHTVQQRGGAAPAAKGRLSQPGDPAELEADALADQLIAGVTGPLPVTATPAGLARKGRTARDLDFPEVSDGYMLDQARRNVAHPTPGWIGGSHTVSHADMLALGYELRSIDGKWRHYHLPGTDPGMTFNVLVNPEDDVDAPPADDSSIPQRGDPPALREARQLARDWSETTKKTLPIYDRLRALRAAGQGNSPEYDQLIQKADNLFDQAKEYEQDFQESQADWRQQLEGDPDNLAKLDEIATGDATSLRTWVEDFKQNRDTGANQRSDDEWKRRTEELQRQLEEQQQQSETPTDTPPEEAPPPEETPTPEETPAPEEDEEDEEEEDE